LRTSETEAIAHLEPALAGAVGRVEVPAKPHEEN
jgi:hypothetical protein